MNKRFEVLDGLPAYGDMAVPIVSDDEVFVSEGYVVKFYKDDGSTWIANFPQGLSSLSFVKEIPNNNSVLVVAGGDGYLMNPNHTKPIQEFNYFADEMVERDDGKLILASLAEIIFLDENARLIEDPDHSDEEDRFIIIGLSVKLKILTVVHCYRDNENIIRIISARKSTKNEQRQYKEFLS